MILLIIASFISLRARWRAGTTPSSFSDGRKIGLGFGETMGEDVEYEVESDMSEFASDLKGKQGRLSATNDRERMRFLEGGSVFVGAGRGRTRAAGLFRAFFLDEEGRAYSRFNT
mmetsp:Transcript_20056/g.28240  ORF Transcript_20056/g.28240 Transcript_20056/m.28240 type:complete len:115 (+) Transcript_20056:349-693(+)